MKPIDVVLSILTLAAVGLGYAAYRAWHPTAEISGPAAAVETSPYRSPEPAVVRRVIQPQPVAARRVPHNLQAGVVDRVECRNGMLYWHDVKQGTRPVAAPNGRDAARCEIQMLPGEPQSLPATD